MIRDRSLFNDNSMFFLPTHGSLIAKGVCSLTLIASIVLAFGAAQTAAAAPYGFGDVRLGASFEELSRQLDFRDINAALEAQRAAKAHKPNLGRRGFGCMRGANAYADIVCVSHQEQIGGEPTREIRLQFLDGVLQKFSITVELDRSGAVLSALHAQYGEPRESRAGDAGTFASQHWRNAESAIAVFRGPDLVFVSFELAGYGAAVAKRQRPAAPVPP